MRLEHCEPFVVLGGDHQVFHPGIAGQAGNPGGIEIDRVELRRQLFVFADRDFLVTHDPLGRADVERVVPLAARDGIQSPVNEHPEPGVPPPGHVRVSA